MKKGMSVAGGLAGSMVLTAFHESLRRTVPGAPRMDLLGVQALARVLNKAGISLPESKMLYYYTLAGDIAGNAGYYSLAGIGNKKTAPVKGSLLGLLAGLGAVGLPGPLGLSKSFSKRTPLTAIMTVGLYVAGGIAAGLLIRKMNA